MACPGNLYTFYCVFLLLKANKMNETKTSLFMAFICDKDVVGLDKNNRYFYLIVAIMSQKTVRLKVRFKYDNFETFHKLIVPNNA